MTDRYNPFILSSSSSPGDDQAPSGSLKSALSSAASTTALDQDMAAFADQLAQSACAPPADALVDDASLDNRRSTFSDLLVAGPAGVFETTVPTYRRGIDPVPETAAEMIVPTLAEIAAVEDPHQLRDAIRINIRRATTPEERDLIEHVQRHCFICRFYLDPLLRPEVFPVERIPRPEPLKRPRGLPIYQPSLFKVLPAETISGAEEREEQRRLPGDAGAIQRVVWGRDEAEFAAMIQDEDG